MWCLLTANIDIIFNSVSTTDVSIYFKSPDYNVGVAGDVGNYTNTALANDMSIRTWASTN